jgi:hypothetical protein
MVFVTFKLKISCRILCTVCCGVLACWECVLFPIVTCHVTGNFPFTNTTNLSEHLKCATLMGLFVCGSVPKVHTKHTLGCNHIIQSVILPQDTPRFLRF